MVYKEKLQKINQYEYLLPKSVRKEMKVDGKVISNDTLLKGMQDGTIEQLSNVCCLPGAVEPVVALPDAHFGYQNSKKLS